MLVRFSGRPPSPAAAAIPNVFETTVPVPSQPPASPNDLPPQSMQSQLPSSTPNQEPPTSTEEEQYLAAYEAHEGPLYCCDRPKLKWFGEIGDLSVACESCGYVLFARDELMPDGEPPGIILDADESGPAVCERSPLNSFHVGHKTPLVSCPCYPPSVLVTLTVPADNDRGPQYMEQALAAIHQANAGRLPIEFAFGVQAGTVALSCRFPTKLAVAVAAQLSAHYPAATIERLAEMEAAPATGYQTWTMELRLRPDLFPIRRYAQFDDFLNRNVSDPLTGIFAALLPGHAGRFHASIVIITRPAKSRRIRQARKAIRRLASPFFRSHGVLARWYASASSSSRATTRILARVLGLLGRVSKQPRDRPNLATSSSRAHDREEDLQAAADKLGRHLFEAHIRLSVAAAPKDAAQAQARIRQMAGAFGQFTVPRMAKFHVSAVPPKRIHGRGFLLSCEELATLWHPATATVRAPAMQITESRELEPPVGVPRADKEADLAVLGRLKFRDRRGMFGIRADDRRRHLAIIGKTGMGKTTLLQKLISDDILAGRGLALVDPHGDLAEAMLDAIPRHRTNDVILFDAGDRDYPLSFNVLSCKEADQRGLVASAVVSVFKKLYGDSWGPRLEHILRNALLALLEVPGTSLLALQRLLSDLEYRKSIVSRVHDPVVRSFWEKEFATWKPQYRAEAIAPIQNKVGQFLSQPILRAIVGQSRTSLDLRRVMDDGQILIVNLSKGRIGEDASMLLGSLVVTSIQLATMSRADMPEKDRRDFALYVDEFQNFATDSFATILSEARKYRLSLVLANQYLAQMDEATAEAVFGNVGSLLVFQVGARDAEALAEQLGGDVTPQDLMALPRYTAYLRLLIDGMPSRPFSVETVPPPRHNTKQMRSTVIRRTSRHRYTRPANEVEAEVRQAFALGA